MSWRYLHYPWDPSGRRRQWDLPGILRALWRTHLLTQEQVRSLVTQIEEKDRIVFKDQENSFAE
jgi:hypothetical protein